MFTRTQPWLNILKPTVFLPMIFALIACGGTTPNTSTPPGSTSSSSSSSSSSSGVVHSTCPSEESAAFEQFPRLVPGAIEAEDYDPNAYFDTTDENEGGEYRTDSGVDIKQVDGGYAVGWMVSGEYLEYSVYVERAGEYDVTIRSGAVGAGRTLHVTQCETGLIEAFDVPSVSTWGQLKTWHAGSVYLNPGLQKIRVTVGAVDYLDLDWIHFGTYTGTIDPPSTPSEPNTGVNHPFFLGNITTSGQVRDDFVDFWDQITPENEGKWGSVEATRDNYNWGPLDRIYEYARANDIPVKAHTLVWGSQRPSWIDSLSPSEQAVEIEQWIRDYCDRYPDTQLIDVVNESTPGHAPAEYARSAFGDDWIIRSFELTRLYCPNAVLILNDYNVLSWNTTEFIDMARPVVEAGVVDAIGLQAHGLEDWSLTELTNKLNRIADFGLPIYVSEYDVARTNDQEQLRIYQEQFPLFYNHPSVKGITLWGYVYDRTWVEGSGLIQENGEFRPAMTWLMDYIRANPK